LSNDISKKEYDLLIVGGGPAGLTAAAYAIRKRLETMLISDDLGGKTNYEFTLPNVETHLVIDGQEIVSKFKNQIEYLDFAKRLGKVTKIEKTTKGFVVTTTDGVFKGKAVIVATGVNPKRLNIPGEQEFLGHGVSYSTVSHAPVFVDMEVAVIGNGLDALQAAAELAQVAKKVNLVGLPKRLLTTPLGKKIQASGKANLLSEYDAVEIKGQDSPEKLVIKPKTKGDQSEISANGIFIELGYAANTSMVPRTVKRTKGGQLIVNAKNQTSMPGLFAAGDVTDVNAQQVLIAIGEGANAALGAYEYVLNTKK